ncbi:hypothetical protein D9M72_610830 [compost metagenome]
MDDAHDDLLAVLRHLRHLQAAVQQEEEACRLLALLEDGVALRHAARGRMGQQSVEVFVAHPLEQGERAHDGPVDLHNP